MMRDYRAEQTAFRDLLEAYFEDDSDVLSGSEGEIIYQIQDLCLYGNFDQGVRGVDHNILLFEGYTWSDIIFYGTLVVPETRVYISDDEVDTFEQLGYQRLPSNDNQYVRIHQND